MTRIGLQLLAETLDHLLVYMLPTQRFQGLNHQATLPVFETHILQGGFLEHQQMVQNLEEGQVLGRGLLDSESWTSYVVNMVRKVKPPASKMTEADARTESRMNGLSPGSVTRS